MFSSCQKEKVGLNGLEPSTSRLSGVRSNQLSYRPVKNVVALCSKHVALRTLSDIQESDLSRLNKIEKNENSQVSFSLERR